jgi:glycosyltransferase involved in cell wall biosynthesis
MPSLSETPLRVAFFVDTFPRRTENFILREIAGALRFWPHLRVYCFREQTADWGYVDCRDTLRRIPHTPLTSRICGILKSHLECMARFPFRYLAVLGRSLRIHGFLNPIGLRRFDQGVRLAQLARRDGVNHLHAHFVCETATVCHLAARMLGVPYTLSAHARDLWAGKPKRDVIQEAECCIACSAEARDHLLREFPEARVHLVHHGIAHAADSANGNERDSARPEPPPLRIVSAGRFIPKKGFDILIAACALLRDRGLDFHCGIVGNGELEGFLKESVENAHLADRVQILPFEPYGQLRQRFASAHLCVLPCRIDSKTGDRDGIPNILLESMDCGAVVVSTSLPTIRELIENGVTGFLAKPEDPADLARTIEEALRNHATWPTIWRQARQVLMREFDFQTNLERFRRLIEGAHGNS